MWAITTTGASDWSEGLVAKGGVDFLIKIIHEGTDPQLRRHAIRVIANLLTCDDRVRMMLLDEGGLDMIFDIFVQNEDRELQKGAVRCIMYLVKNLETRAALSNRKNFYSTLIKVEYEPKP